MGLVAVTQPMWLLDDLVPSIAALVAGMAIVGVSWCIAGSIARDAKRDWRKACELAGRIHEHEGRRDEV